MAQRGTVGLCWSKGSRATGCQSWRSKKILPSGPVRTRFARAGPFGRIFFQTSNFDGWQLCFPLTNRDPQYLFRKTKISFVEIISVLESSSTFKVFHLCSKYSHFNSLYLLSRRFHLKIAVCVCCMYILTIAFKNSKNAYEYLQCKSTRKETIFC